MKTIFLLERYLKDRPDVIKDAQELTLNKEKPSMGLSGKHGLYASDEWWESLNNGIFETKTYEGKISTIKFEGMNNEGKSFTLQLKNGGTYKYSCRINSKKDISLYKEGKTLRVTTYLERLKNGQNIEFVRKIEIENA